MPVPFYVWGTDSGDTGSFTSNANIDGGRRDGIATSGDGDIDDNPAGLSAELGYTGVPSATGINGLRTLTFSDGGTAVWGAGSGGGFVIPTNEIAYDALNNSTAFTVTGQTPISSAAYSTFFVPTAPPPPLPPANTAPEAADDVFTTTEDARVAGNLLAPNSDTADTDADGNPLTVVSITSSTGVERAVNEATGTGLFILASGAHLRVNADGSFTYDPFGFGFGGASSLTDFDRLDTGEIGFEAFTYVVSDGNGGFDEATVTITVNGVNDAPIAVIDSIKVTEDDAQGSINLLNGNIGPDVDPEGGPLAITQIRVDGQSVTVDPLTGGTLTLGSGASITVLADGTATFFTNGAFEDLGNQPGQLVQRNINFTYTVADENGLTDTALLQVFVAGVNDAPTITAGTTTLTTTNEDTASSATLVSTLLTDRSFDDVDTGNAQGIAVIGVTGSGTWQSSPDAGASGWTSFGPGIVFDIFSAYLFGPTTSIQYIPNGVDGETATFTWRGWDQTESSSTIDSRNTGGTFSLSSNTATASLTVSSIDDEPTLTATGADPDHQPGTGSALFSAAMADTIETGQTFASLTLTVSGLADGADETLRIDGSTVALTDGSFIVSQTNNLAVFVSVNLTTATVFAAGGTLDIAQLQTLVDEMTYNNTSATPTPGNRVVTITELVDSGSNTAPNDNTATLSLVSTVSVVEAPSLVVTTTADVADPFDGETSLREAVAFANSDSDASVITFASDVGDAFETGRTITLLSQLEALTTELTIDGDVNGDGIADVTIDADGTGRIFEINAATSDVTLDSLNLTGGVANEGGAIRVITSGAQLLLRDSSVYGNSASNVGGAINLQSGTSLTVERSTFSDNVAGTSITSGGGGAINAGNATLTVSDSTFNGNSVVAAGFSGGALQISGGSGTFSISNSTFFANEADNVGGAIIAAGSGSLTNVTITNNTAPGGGSVSVQGATIDIANSIIVGNNTAGTSDADFLTFVATVNETGPNLIGSDATYAEVFGSNTLADNGGPVQTMALLADARNPALDAGDDALDAAADARGEARFDQEIVSNNGADVSDLGAYELQGGIVNDPPSLDLTPVLSELAENTGVPARLKVADLAIIEDDVPGTNVLSLTGADADLFELDGTELFLKAGAVLDFETNSVLDVVVSVSDSTLGSSSGAALSVAVTDVNEAPELLLDQLVDTVPSGVSGPERNEVATVGVQDDGTGSNLLSLAGADAAAFELEDGVLYLKPGFVLSSTRSAIDVQVNVDDPDLGSGPEDSVMLSFDVIDTTRIGSDTDDLLIGTPISDTLSGLGGNDTMVGLQSDDILDGGRGSDVAVFTGPAGNYTIALTPDGVIVTDRREGGDGSDLLIDVEAIRFGPDPAGVSDDGAEFDLDSYSGVVGLTADQLETITQFYVGLFDRNPDAFGLFFWSTQLANGVAEAAIALAFIDSPEAIALYGSAPGNSEIVETAYQNFFEREIDLAGQVFWTNLLNLGVITVPEFFTLLDDGASALTGSVTDAQTLQDQVDVGLYFAAINGLSDVSDATTTLALYDTANREASLQEAQDEIDVLASAAGASGSGEFLIQLTGVIDDPFV
ncbi:Ig-like domain-containing protein [Marivita sp.]|uniref:Ig-like domain-containing protein n=1 Tax=Marivita sp. TaxID=2003365 RepID=UPI003A8A2502